MSFPRTNYSGYVVENRSALLSHLAALGAPPRFSRVIAEHVTFRYPDPLPAPPASEVLVVGRVAGEGVEALLVSVDGSSSRPSGGHFHLTLSLAPGHKPAESNALLAAALEAGTVEALVPFALQVSSF